MTFFLLLFTVLFIVLFFYENNICHMMSSLWNMKGDCSSIYRNNSEMNGIQGILSEI